MREAKSVGVIERLIFESTKAESDRVMGTTITVCEPNASRLRCKTIGAHLVKQINVLQYERCKLTQIGVIDADFAMRSIVVGD